MRKNLIYRFDDIHPLMNKEAFACILSLSEYCPRSIMLCLIPNNKDKSLNNSKAPIPNFWHKLVKLESKGVVIGLHGLEHKLKASNKSLLNVSKKSEYTGLSYLTQKKMILKGLSILKSKGLNPKFFAAPAHGFDKQTLKVLADINLRNISDGFSRNVCNKNGLTWIPLKSWNPKTKFIGRYNTVCIHLNKDNIKQIKDNIKEQILQKKNIDFESLINSSNEYTILDYFSEMIYSILIKLLFLKKKFSKLIE